jgi:hypothetical protein
MRPDIPVVMLCGGMGTRLAEETDVRPKLALRPQTCPQRSRHARDREAQPRRTGGPGDVTPSGNFLKSPILPQKRGF